jgi:hypothetical protein
MSIFAADYDTLAERDERLATLFGRRLLRTKPYGSLIDQMTYTNADRDGFGLARGILRQMDKYPEAFQRILDAYDTRMEGTLPRAVLLREAAKAGWEENRAAFLYGISPAMCRAFVIDGPHAFLIGSLVGDIESRVTESLLDLGGRLPIRLNYVLPRVKHDWDEMTAREALCGSIVGDASGRDYDLLLAGVQAVDLARHGLDRSMLIRLLDKGHDVVYAAEAMKAGVTNETAIVNGAEQDIPVEYLAEVSR